MSHFDRERIPERVVHAKGAGMGGGLCGCGITISGITISGTSNLVTITLSTKPQETTELSLEVGLSK